MRSISKTVIKKPTKSKDISRLSDASASPTNSNNDLYIHESVSPVSDQGCIVGSVTPNFDYPLTQNIPYQYQSSTSYANSSSINNIHNNNNSVAHMTNINHGHRRTPSVLTPPSTPINVDLLTLNLGNGLPAHLYSHNYSNGVQDFPDDKLSTMHYSGYGNQTTSDYEWYNGYPGCTQNVDYIANDVIPLDLQSYNNSSNSYTYDPLKLDGHHSNYFEDEKKYDVTTDVSRNIPNSYIQYNDC